MKTSVVHVLTFAAALLGALYPNAHANNWGEMAMISSTMGVSGSRVCIGEASRGDIGCPAYAPTISPTGTLNVSSGLVVNQVSLTTSGVTWGYLASTVSYLPQINAGTISATTIQTSAPTSNNHVTTKAYVDSVIAGATVNTGVVCASTVVSYTGNLGGVSGANAKCEAEYGTGWRFASPFAAASGLSVLMQNFAVWLNGSHASYGHCNNWTNGSNNSVTGMTTSTNASGYQVSSQGCDNRNPILCCRH